MRIATHKDSNADPIAKDTEGIRPIRLKKAKSKSNNKINNSTSFEVLQEKLRLDFGKINHENLIMEENDSMSEDTQYFGVNNKELEVKVSNASERNSIQSRGSPRRKRSGSSDFKLLSQNQATKKNINMKLLAPSISPALKQDKKKDSKVLSLKRASFWQFNNIHDNLKSLYSNIKYNNKLIREKDKEIDEFKKQMKIQNRVNEKYQ